MSSHIRIDEATHATLREFAQKEHATIPDVVRKAVEALRRERFLAEMAAGAASLTDDERADDARDVELWDMTSGDGLDAPW
jgi:predicted transcriptional regulator